MRGFLSDRPSSGVVGQAIDCRSAAARRLRRATDQHDHGDEAASKSKQRWPGLLKRPGRTALDSFQWL